MATPQTRTSTKVTPRNRLASLAGQRGAAIRAIKKLVEPHFHDSGYVTRVDPTKCRFAEGNRRPVRMWATKGHDVVELPGMYVLTSFIAITEFGPMTDAHGGGMVWEDYACFPLEDLIRLRAWAEKTFGETKH